MTNPGHLPLDGRMPRTQQPLLDTAEVARLLGCHIRTVHRMVARGTLTYSVKAPGLRGAYLYDRAAVEALIARTQGSAA